jgi:hypothetical protein
MSVKIQPQIAIEGGNELSARVHYSEYGKLSSCYVVPDNYEFDGPDLLFNAPEKCIVRFGAKADEKIWGREMDPKAVLPYFSVTYGPRIHNDQYSVARGLFFNEKKKFFNAPKETPLLWEIVPYSHDDNPDLSVIKIQEISNLWYSPKSPIDVLIEKSMAIKDLPYDWDEEGALPIEEAALSAATSFLKKYYSFISKSYNLQICLPEINPCKDGSVDLEWHTPKAQLLINFRKDKESNYIAYYYGDRHNNKMQVKGSTPVFEFSEHLAVWMKFLV